MSYVQGYKLENGLAKPISAFIIYVDEVPVGYIQIYNAYDFARTIALTGLPSPNLAAFDVFIGEKQFLNKGIGSRVIDQFLISYAASFTHVFVDPDSTNLAAIRAYQKAGFKKADIQPDTGEIWLIRKQMTRLSQLIEHLELLLLEQSVRQSKNQLNKLIADDFVEFGKSGVVYNKQDILDSLPSEVPRTFTLIDFEVKELSENIALATYKTIENAITTLKSSIWQYQNGEWRMIFHQGTKAK